MTVLFHLIPKAKVAYALDDFTLRQLAEKMIASNITAIPVLDEKGHYVRTVSEGDLFRYIKEHSELNIKAAEEVKLSSIGCEREVFGAPHTSTMDDLIDLSMMQNFVPILDDSGVFMGIVTRKAIIYYLKEKTEKKENI